MLSNLAAFAVCYVLTVIIFYWLIYAESMKDDAQTGPAKISDKELYRED